MKLFTGKDVACNIDNLLRPILIRKLWSFLFMVIFAGVIRGLSSFRIVGLFIAPVVLAVTLTLGRTI